MSWALVDGLKEKVWYNIDVKMKSCKVHLISSRGKDQPEWGKIIFEEGSGENIFS